MSERANLHLNDFVRRGVSALLKRNVMSKDGKALQAIVAINIIDMMSSRNSDKDSHIFPYDKDLITRMDKALDIDSYYATCLHKVRYTCCSVNVYKHVRPAQTHGRHCCESTASSS